LEQIQFLLGHLSVQNHGEISWLQAAYTWSMSCTTPGTPIDVLISLRMPDPFEQFTYIPKIILQDL
jgi:hypothetical protein